MVPSLALEHRKPRKLSELVGRRLYQHQLTLLRQHQQHVLVGQKHELAVAVPFGLPLSLSVLEIDARQGALVEPKGMALVNDKSVKLDIEILRCPALFGGPSARSPPGPALPRSARAVSPHSVADTDHKFPIRSHGWLHNARVRWPRVIQSSLPSASATLVAPVEVISTICGTPSIVKSCGEL